MYRPVSKDHIRITNEEYFDMITERRKGGKEENVVLIEKMRFLYSG